MKKILLILFSFTCVSHAATKEPFTCEKIKDKTTRLSCIESREDKTKENDRLAEKLKIESAEQAEKKVLNDFVEKTKQILVRTFKDPQSTQYENLTVTKNMLGYTSLCGSVNSKNSYGGYVGFKKFYVIIDPIPYSWIYEEANYRGKIPSQDVLDKIAKIDQREFEAYELICKSKSDTIIQL